MGRNPELEAKLEAGRRIKPLQTIITEYGDAPKRWDQFERCPFCQGKKCAAVLRHEGREFFKCLHNPCPTSNKGLDEIGYIASKTGQSRRDAVVAFLKMSGQWQEERLSPSVMPGQRARRSKALAGAHEAAAVEPVGAGEGEPKAEAGNGDGEAEHAAAVAVAEALGVEAEGGSAVGEPDLESGSRWPEEPGEAIIEVPRDADVALVQTSAGEDEPKAVVESAAEASESGPDGSTEGAEKKVEAEVEATVPPPVRALREFYAQCRLSAEDAAELARKRGLVGAMALLAGIVSNPRSNESLLLDLGKRYSPQVLIEAGLWKRETGASEAKPSGRYYGFHTWEEKDDAGKKQAKSGWTYPVLIPYWDREGQLVALRPHRAQLKDMVVRVYEAENCLRRPEAQQILADAGWSLPASTGNGNGEGEAERASAAVVTEGEFKALALLQAAWFGEGKRLAVASIPGISMSKNLWGDLTDWLDVAALPSATVIAAFDSEDKSTPGLPGYKADVWKRFDAEKWALYLAWRITKQAYDGRVAMLPKEWRDAKGKADWDGALAMMLWQDKATEQPPKETQTVEEISADAAERWKIRKGRIGTAFRKVLAGANKDWSIFQMGLFDDVATREIRKGLAKLCAEPMLPIGDSAEEGIRSRLLRFYKRSEKRLPGAVRGYLLHLADAYGKLGGGYYVMRPLSEKRQEKWEKLLSEARDAEDVELRRVCELAAKGTPERITDFFLDPHYMVRSEDGSTARIVSLVSVYGGRKQTVQLPGEWFSQPVKFRQWLLEQGGYSFGMGSRGGEIQLQCLQADLNRELADKTVTAVTLRGHHEDSGLWF